MASRLRQFAASKTAPTSTDENDDGKSLHTVLDEAQQTELVTLICKILDSMRETISLAFPQSTARATSGAHRSERSDRATPSKTATPERRSSSYPPDAVPSGLNSQARLRALRYFDEWRETVLRRISEVLHQSEAGSKKHEQTLPQANDDDRQDVRLLQEVYPPVESSLFALPRVDRLLILHSLLLLLLSLKHYSAHSRVLLLRVASSLRIPLQELNEDERKTARGLLDVAVTMSADEEAKKRIEENKEARRWKVGLATVAGAALIGITGGLAAPLLAAGIGTIMGGLGLGGTIAAGYLGALASSGVIVGGLFGAYGGRMTGKMMDKYAREVEDFAFIPTRGVFQEFLSEKDAAKEDRRLRVTIGITGWANEEEDIVTPWRVISAESEVFALRWEYEALLNLGNSMRALVTTAAWTIARQQILSRTIFAGIMSAVMLPYGLVKLSRIAANPFSVAMSRAQKAGEVLADALINKAQGERPVTLIGYSLGSRVMFCCLRSLARRRAYGLIESAIFMGSPVPSDEEDWRIMRTVVSGRLVNIYSENDAVLALLYRATSMQAGIAGLERVEHVPGVENVDVSDLVSGHLRYRNLIGQILRRIKFTELDPAELRREEAALQQQDRDITQQRERNERRRRERMAQRPSQPKDKDGEEDEEESQMIQLIDEEEQEVQEEVKQQTREKMMQRHMKKLSVSDGDRP
ncbi:hypothetical protein VTN31DRAFT_7032 [Thermomyces dupontii]|uniref:uncharacterized protein n=1 Tax=Talaromyces thermophilus TaxID=28565 RepID=UPI0037442997